MSIDPRRIVVGFDGSDHAGVAVDWAAAEAERTGRPLHVLFVTRYGVLDAPTAPRLPDLVQIAAGHVVAEGVRRARKTATEVPVEGGWASDGVSLRLVEASHEASLLVVGNRGHGDVVAAVTGSVGFTVAEHAHCPVVVVPGPGSPPPGPDRPVVVGVDGSAPADDALDFAATTAAESGARLVVVSAYQSSQDYWDPDTIEKLDRQVCAGTQELVDGAVRRATTAHPGLPVDPVVRLGRPADVLADVGKQAGLMVVGSRGRGAFAGLLLGSTSHRLIHVSTCPVAVLR